MNKTLLAVTAAAIALAGPASAANDPGTVVLLKRDQRLYTVYAWERWGNFINAAPGDGKEIPYDAAKLFARVYVFPTGEIRVIDFHRGARTHDHVNMTDMVQYNWTGRRVQFAQDQAALVGPGDASFHPKGVFHHGETLQEGKNVEFAYYVDKVMADPKANWLNTGNTPMVRSGNLSIRSYDFGAYVTREIHAPRGATVPISGDKEHLMFVLSGRFSYTVGDKTYELGPEDAARAPEGMPVTLKALEDSAVAETLFDPKSVKPTR